MELSIVDRSPNCLWSVSKEFPAASSVLSPFQSGFLKNHSAVTATMKIINDIAEGLDKKQSCLSLWGTEIHYQLWSTVVYSKVSWTSLHTQLLNHWYVFIYKTILVMSRLLMRKLGHHNL